AEQLIDDFKGDKKTAASQVSDSEITIAISVDMLDTGIDVPEVVNLVFAKPVKSKVKFWQMIGRGTRLCENLFGPGQHKQKFLIFDHWGNFEYHALEQEEAPVSTGKPLAQKHMEAWVDLAKAAQKDFQQDTVKTVAKQLKDQLQALDANTIA
ncbi:helicase-related protein, partial [Sansalvadorimonas verongulae]|uniref:helicase-related protein n=1 Tax=Sansalvadorimonas verongulae TaxID=2172824 RepID=UPI0022A6A56B